MMEEGDSNAEPMVEDVSGPGDVEIPGEPLFKSARRFELLPQEHKRHCACHCCGAFTHGFLQATLPLAPQGISSLLLLRGAGVAGPRVAGITEVSASDAKPEDNPMAGTYTVRAQQAVTLCPEAPERLIASCA